MNKEIKRERLVMMASVLAIAVFAAALLWFGPRQDVPAQDASGVENAVLEQGCELLQTLTYTRCSHVVTRRVTAPVEMIGQNLAGAEALYPDWKIVEFGAKLVKMERRMDLFCPDHLVLMPDGAGFLCVFENRYGDAMALVRELEVPVSTLPAAVQEEVERGAGFSTAEELELWLEGVES